MKLPAGSLSELRKSRVRVVKGGRHGIAVFAHDGRLFALDNRCPHLGFPLDRGTVKDGVVTCHWHHWRFDMATGGCFTDGGDDVRGYPVTVEGDEVYVDTTPPPKAEAVAAAETRLGKALEQANTLGIAKSVVRLRAAGFTADQLIARIARFGAQFRNEWSPGMSILAALGRLIRRVPMDRELEVLALTHAGRAVAQACEGKPSRRAREPLPGPLDFDAIKEKFRLFVDEREAAGAERCLMTALRDGATREQATDLLTRAATDHVYIDEGHPYDYINKAFELLEIVGWDEAPRILPLLVPPLCEAQWYEEQSEWRYPFDFPAALAELAPTPGSAGVEAYLTDDPRALLESVARGADALELGAAAAYRMARFNLKNEIFDWENAHHAFTYANAVSEVPTMRAILHGAVKLYLVRFLTIPPARLPAEVSAQIPRHHDALASMDAAVSAKRVTDAAHALFAHLRDGGDRDALLGAMTAAALREDAGFHMVQSLEAAVTLSDRLAGTPHADVPLVAAIRYLTVHSPTDRFVSSTVDKAIRLERGEDLFLE